MGRSLTTKCTAALGLLCCITHITCKWMMSYMCALMCLQITVLCEWLITHITGKWMISYMCLQMTLQCEWLITHVTGKWMISSTHMSALVCLQITVLCEQLITHITGKWMLCTVCVLMSSRLPWCVKDLLHTSHINRCSPLCMCVNVHHITLMCEGLITHIIC
jgi:hypothetical protein